MTRSDHEPEVNMSPDEFEALKETAHLMRSSANARRLVDSIDRLEAGAGTARELHVESDEASTSHLA